jgi:hypothetical protein
MTTTSLTRSPVWLFEQLDICLGRRGEVSFGTRAKVTRCGVAQNGGGISMLRRRVHTSTLSVVFGGSN